MEAIKSARPARSTFGLIGNSDSDDSEGEEEEEEEEDEAEQALRPLLKFVRVSALPRAASVEFQAVATTSSSQDEILQISEDGVEGRWVPSAFCFAHTTAVEADGTDICTHHHNFLCFHSAHLKKTDESLLTRIAALRDKITNADPTLWDRRLVIRVYISAFSPRTPSETDAQRTSHSRRLRVKSPLTGSLAGLREAVRPAGLSIVPCAGLASETDAALIECICLPVLDVATRQSE